MQRVLYHLKAGRASQTGRARSAGRRRQTWHDRRSGILSFFLNREKFIEIKFCVCRGHRVLADRPDHKVQLETKVIVEILDPSAKKGHWVRKANRVVMDFPAFPEIQDLLDRQVWPTGPPSPK